MLVLASVLWGDGTFFDHDTMRRYDATDQQALDDLARQRRVFWKLDEAPSGDPSYRPREFGLPLLPGLKEDRLGARKAP